MKGPDAFRSISEAAEELGVPQHVLRFWETRFSFVRPMKRAGGRRFYRRQDLEVLRAVRGLLHDAGYTIKGVQKLHRDQGLRRVLAAAGEVDPATLAELEAGEAQASAGLDPGLRLELEDALRALEEAKAGLDRLLTRDAGEE